MRVCSSLWRPFSIPKDESLASSRSVKTGPRCVSSKVRSSTPKN